MDQEGHFSRHRQFASGVLPPLDHSRIELLSLKQKLVLSMVGTGLVPKEIAQILRRNVTSVRDMRRRIMHTLQTDRVEVLVRYAVEAGLVIQRECGAWATPDWVASIPPIGGSLATGTPSPSAPPGPRSPASEPRATTPQSPRTAPRPDPGA